MWVTADYEAATLFSLKYSTATSSGGKTLLVPTPFAIKMALLDSACRTAGVAQAQAWWEMIRDLRVAVRPPEHVVVSNIFQKILRPRRNPVRTLQIRGPRHHLPLLDRAWWIPPRAGPPATRA